jgi:hypothetical protein
MAISSTFSGDSSTRHAEPFAEIDGGGFHLAQWNLFEQPRDEEPDERDRRHAQEYQPE